MNKSVLFGTVPEAVEVESEPPSSSEPNSGAGKNNEVVRLPETDKLLDSKQPFSDLSERGEMEVPAKPRMTQIPSPRKPIALDASQLAGRTISNKILPEPI